VVAADGNKDNNLEESLEIWLKTSSEILLNNNNNKLNKALSKSQLLKQSTNQLLRLNQLRLSQILTSQSKQKKRLLKLYQNKKNPRNIVMIS